MSTQSKFVVLKVKEPIGNQQPQADFKKEKGNRFIAFFTRLNPFNWFADLSNIEFGMEEFESKTK